MLPIPQGKVNRKAVRVLTDEGRSVIEVESLSRMGDKLAMHGVLMAQIEATVFIEAEEMFRIIPMLLRPGVLLFLLISPFYWLRAKLRSSKEEEDGMSSE